MVVCCKELLVILDKAHDLMLSTVEEKVAKLCSFYAAWVNFRQQ